MKVFFDTNAYISEALVAKSATQISAETEKAFWRIVVISCVLDETGHVLLDYFGFAMRLTISPRERYLRRALRFDSNRRLEFE